MSNPLSSHNEESMTEHREPKPLQTSRELADRIYATCVYGSPGTVHFRNADATALIDAWVRVREAEVRADEAKWCHENMDDDFDTPWREHIAMLESTLTTARKQLEEKTKGAPK